MKKSIEDTVIEIVGRVMDVPKSDINDDSSPNNIDAWDSLRHFNLVVELEESYGIEFNEDDIVEMLSVKSIIEKISLYVQ